MTSQTRYSYYALVAAILAAAAIVLTEIIIQSYNISPLLVIILGNVIGGLVLLGSSRDLSEIGLIRQKKVFVRIIAAALTIFTLGFLAGFYAIALIGSGKVALLGQLETFFVVILAITFLGEELTKRHWVAGGFALSGGVVINFDPQALQLSFGWGELLAVTAPLGLAVGIITLKPLLDQTDARWVTGVSLLLGAAFLTPLIPVMVSSFDFAWASALVIVAMGVTRGGAWLAYNTGLRHLGASRCSIIFLSFAFFATLFQATVAKFGPNLGLQLPANLLPALAGGALVAAGIVILQMAPVVEKSD